MKIYLSDQQKNFKTHLGFLKFKKPMQFRIDQLKEKNTTIDIVTNKNLDALNLDFLFAYHIFPSNILTFKTQWDDEQRKMEVGDIIVQQAYLPPNQTVSTKLIFGVSIYEIINDPKRKKIRLHCICPLQYVPVW